jgi:acyl-CoA synthetase (AMP-forming)/AMP-acid ligase II
VHVASGALRPVAGHYRAAGWWDDRTLADGLEAAAAASPDRLAVADATGRLTYADLVARVHGAIAALRDDGMTDGDDVVLVAGNTVEAVVVYHALLRAGATVAVLDRRAGDADLRAALAVLGTDARVVLPASERTRLEPHAGTRAVLGLETLADAAGRASSAVWREPDRDAPRLVLFTSGTTSRPKAVVHSLNTITAGVNNMARITGTGPDTVLFLVSPVTSIAGITQVHLFADRHGALVLDDDFDPDRSLARANEVGATLLGGAPVIAERLVRAAERRPDRRITIRTLALGGAMLPRPLLAQATDELGIEIARVYGSSEYSCATGSVPADTREQRLADDGRLMPGTEVRVGSAHHPHEGLLRGPGLFLGYADPADDAAAFEDGWFRTGDLVEVHDGRLTVVGRLTEVVHRNGLKISLGEIDAALAGLPGVDEHGCFALPDAETGERLVVALRPAPGATVTLADVVAHLERAGVARRKLPEQIVVWDEALSRTPSGKVVRSRLVMESPGRPSETVERLRKDV